MKVISPFYFLKKPSIKFPALNPEFVDIYAFALFRGGHITLMYMYMLQIALSLLLVKCKFNKHHHYLETFLYNVGKTAAYMLPILERLIYRPQQTSVTRVLILTPTRELAIQVCY